MVSNGLGGIDAFFGVESFWANALESAESVASGIGITLPFQLIVTVMPSDLTYSACKVRPGKSVQGCRVCPLRYDDKRRKNRIKDLNFMFLQVLVHRGNAPKVKLSLPFSDPKD